ALHEGRRHRVIHRAASQHARLRARQPEPGRRNRSLPDCLGRTRRIRTRTLMKILLAATLMLAVSASAAPVPVIFDTDMGNDIDDALALAMLHALQTKGEAKLLAVTITKD